MRLRDQYSVSGRDVDQHLPVPFKFTSGALSFVLARDEERRSLVATIETRVDPSTLSLRPDELGDSGELRSSGGIVVADRPPLSEFGSAVVDALAFLYDVPLQFASYGGELVPDTPEDERQLAGFRISREYRGSMAYVDVRGPIHVADVSAAIESLLSRHAGLDLYHDAMRLDRSVARFRELWRFLESAFGRQDAELVELLADYEPAKEMDFTKAELENLRTLRGRASHAASKAGFAELQAVNMQVNAAIARLNSLARHVLLTKKTWGQATTGVERIARTGWVGP